MGCILATSPITRPSTVNALFDGHAWSLSAFATLPFR